MNYDEKLGDHAIYTAKITRVARNGTVLLNYVNTLTGDEVRDHVWLNPRDAGEAIQDFRDIGRGKVVFTAALEKYPKTGNDGKKYWQYNFNDVADVKSY
jgi:hypothetical protein